MSKERQLIYRTLWGLVPLVEVPINKNRLVTHIVYFVMPLAGVSKQLWRRQVGWIRDVRHEFNGRLLVGIATPNEADKIEREYVHSDIVKQSFVGLDAEFFIEKNDETIGEGVLFLKMLEAIETRDPDEVFFYGHSKGVTKPTKRAPQIWAEASFTTLFRNRDAVVSALDIAGVVGPFLMPGGYPEKMPGVGPNWFFSGTFFAARSVDVFRRNWRELSRCYGCVELWPGENFERHEVACVFFDDVAGLYDEDYWDDVVTPAFERWKRENGRLDLTGLSTAHV